eukprot:TRINITY_DN40116_c0_g1_i1.p1 TRINITY_DN40116_c0_g1~~TRINITY_DN40116_c0_g1_i1.p1  ORF type:complete len:381 (-),score=24.02 TRINITY_DN40116_c0_g1_i1:163-1305(-)
MVSRKRSLLIECVPWQLATLVFVLLSIRVGRFGSQADYGPSVPFVIGSPHSRDCLSVRNHDAFGMTTAAIKLNSICHMSAAASLGMRPAVKFASHSRLFGVHAIAACGAIACGIIFRGRFCGGRERFRWRRSRGSGACLLRRAGQALMPWKIPNSSSWMWLDVRELLLRERVLMITEYIDEGYANACLSMLLHLQSEDAQKPIHLYFASPGAALRPALALYDTICQLKAQGCRVTTVNYALSAGLGVLLVAAGSDGRRYATPNSMFSLRQLGLELGVSGQADDIEVETKQVLRDNDRVLDELARATRQPREVLARDLRRTFYLSATAALDYGLVDRVLESRIHKGDQLTTGTRDPWSGLVTMPKVGFGVFADPNQPRTAV